MKPTEWQRTLANHVPDNDLISKYIRNSHNSVALPKSVATQLKNRLE
jgi:hypothetical protein